MLSLNRNVGEIVLVGGGALIILGVEGGNVRIGFDFPEDTEIWRSELRHLTPAARRLIEARKASQAEQVEKVLTERTSVRQ
jgi:carbon storage regulator CsrA